MDIMGFLRTVLWILLDYYLLKILGRILRPFVGKYLRRKADQYYRQASSAARGEDADPGRVGEVTIESRPPVRKRPSRVVGEYVEFEEVQ